MVQKKRKLGSKGEPEKNYDLDFFKLYYSFIIVGFHLYNSVSQPSNGHLIGGNSAVSYYLLVSGMLLFASFDRREKIGMLTPGRFFIHRYKRFFFAVAVAYLYAFILRRCIIGNMTLKKLPSYLASDIWEILLVKMNGMNNNNGFMNSPVWTISSIFLVGCVFWCFLYTNKRLFLNLIVPLSLIIGFGVATHLESGSYPVWMGITTAGTLRAWNLMGLGYYCYALAAHIRDLKLSKVGRIAITVAELLCHAVALVCMENWNARNFRWTCELFFCIAAAIGFSGQSLVSEWLRHLPFVRFLANFSLGVYLVHRPLLSLFEYCFGAENIYVKKWLFLAVLLVATVLFQIAVFSFEKLCNVISRGCKKAFCTAETHQD